MIFLATCPVCAVFTRTASELENCASCNCKEPYIFEPDPERNTPEQLEAYDANR